MPSILFLAVLVCTIFSTRAADDIGLVRVAERWRYLKGTAEPPAHWTELNFSDAEWSEQMSGFSTPGGFGEATVLLDYGSNYSTLYFRKKFTVSDTNTVKELLLRLDYDDGFIVYFNGTEIIRRWLVTPQGTPVPFNALATASHPRNSFSVEEFDISNGIQALRPGDNVMAVQIVSRIGLGDSSVVFVPELLANFLRAPYVQNTTTNSTQIIWETVNPSAGFIEYGTTISNASRLQISTDTTNHVASLSALNPDTIYKYRVGFRSLRGEAWSAWSEFRTFKSAGSVSFAVFGDSGWALPGQYAVAEQLARTPLDLIMHVGDLVYPAIDTRNADQRLLSVYAPKLRTTPMFLAMGNHDSGVSVDIPLSIFYLPTNNVTGSEHYYSFDQGDVHFVALWSYLAQSSYHPGSVQYQWLEQDLAKSNKPWKFIFFHHCWRTSSIHIVDDIDFNRVRDTEQLDELAQLAARLGVNCIFHGHDHCYERFTPKYGMQSILTGGGGGGLYGMHTPHPDSVIFLARHHFSHVNVEGDIATIRAIDDKGVVMDTLHLARSFPGGIRTTGTWNTPKIESSGPDDADGNIAGQTFDFQGTAITGKPGKSTSAGRLFVNNDAEMLYLGLDEMELHAGEEVFLFVEGSQLRGEVSPDALGLKMQLIDFSPGLVINVGDEYADSESDFAAPPTPQQGARFLRAGLPAVTGQQLQQFNRSPQSGTAFYEQQSNFAELALPLSALGLKAGDEIRIAAVTAFRPPTTAPGSLRSVDLGGIVRDLNTNNGVVTVSPLTVQLAANPVVDSDADGVPDSAELIAGTDPNSASSVLRISLQKRTGSRYELVWPTVAGRKYTLQHARAGQDFVKVSEVIGLGTPERFTITPSNEHRYVLYRVIVSRE